MIGGMGFVDWLKGLFGAKKPETVTRAVGRTDVAPLDKVEETVQLDGGPYKPLHRRRALRDKRLLPKPKRSFLEKKPKVMTHDEATRLFAGTLRTTQRNIRDLLPDEPLLVQHELPLWRTEAELAEGLGLSVRALRHYAIHREREPVSHYVTFAIPKRRGGERLIMAPKRRLKAIQRRLHTTLVAKLPVSDAAHGFRKGRSTRTGAGPHVGRAVVVHFDLKDFFPSITYARVRGLLLSLGYGYPVAAALAVLMTEAERQPVEVDGRVSHVPVGPRVTVQGAPTSPGLANAIAMKLDRRLLGLAKRLGFNYTRYADDLCFSGDDPTQVSRLIGGVRQIARSEGFRLNREKLRIQRKAGRQDVTGVTVNQMAGLSRRERRKIRAEIHQESKAKERGQLDPKRARALTGRLAYLEMLNPEQAAKLRARRK